MYPDTSILVAEDEELTRKGVLKTLLQSFKGQVHIQTAEDGLQAMQELKENRFDLLITDIRMPGMDGIELVQMIRKQNIDISIIFLTGFAEFEYARQALRLNAVEFLLKPLEKETLIQAVEDALQNQKKNKRVETISKMINPEFERSQEKLVSSRNPTIQKAVEFISQHLDTSYGIKDVAEYVHFNANYLSVLFKEEVGLTFSEYVTKLRIQYAKKLLIDSDLTIYEIANKVGYKTVRYFVKVFREQEGLTPKQYRTSMLDQ